LVVFAANFLLGRGLVPSFALAVAIALGIVPEALPAVTATTLALGAAQLARKKVLVRRLAAVEDLSAVNVLCTDKTGTLTENRTELTYIWTRIDEKAAIESAVLCSTFPEPDNIVDQAVLGAARARGLDIHLLANESRTIAAPFSADTKSMAVVLGGQLVWKGAAGVILKHCRWLRSLKETWIWLRRRRLSIPRSPISRVLDHEFWRWRSMTSIRRRQLICRRR